MDPSAFFISIILIPKNFYLVYILGHSKFFLRVYPLAQFEILGLFSRIFQKMFPFW